MPAKARSNWSLRSPTKASPAGVNRNCIPDDARRPSASPQPGREPSLEERLELGKLFESLLGQCRERHTQQVLDTLSPYCAEIRAIDPGAEQMIMKLVCLVHKDRQQRFENGIQEAARKFDDHYTFKYSGPWAPFDFVDISLHLP